MPEAHRKHLEWSPSRLIHWGESIGHHTGQLVRKVLESRRHPEQGYRTCLGILRLCKGYGPLRLEAAAERAVAMKAYSYRHVDSILKNGMDRLPLEDEQRKDSPNKPITHENIRGASYYKNGEEHVH